MRLLKYEIGREAWAKEDKIVYANCAVGSCSIIDPSSVLPIYYSTSHSMWVVWVNNHFHTLNHSCSHFYSNSHSSYTEQACKCLGKCIASLFSSLFFFCVQRIRLCLPKPENERRDKQIELNLEIAAGKKKRNIKERDTQKTKATTKKNI